MALGIAATLLTGCFTPRFARNESVRPLTIRVTDAVSGQPLAGVPVLQVVETMKERPRILGIWPFPIEPYVGPRLRFKARGMTDEHGEVELRAQGFRVPGDEEIYRDFAYVNLDVDPGHRNVQIALESRRYTCAEEPDECPGPVDQDYAVQWCWLGASLAERVAVYRNPIASHRGAIVISDEWEASPWKDWTEPSDRFRIWWNSGSLKRPSDRVEIALVPYASEEELEARIAGAKVAIGAGGGDALEAYAAIARDAGALALLASTEERRGRFREVQREALRSLTRADPASAGWYGKLAETWAEPANRVPTLREGVERFPRDYALRAALGLALCRAGPSPEGIEHLREAARLLPADRSSSEGTSLGTAAWLCGDKANDVARLAAERRAAQGRGAAEE